MAYNKTVWKNGQTKLNADNLNHIEDGISKVSINVDNLSNQFESIPTIYETKTDAGNKLSEAKLDATTKSNKALQDSKAYTDSKKTDAVNESKAYTDELSTTVSTTYETKVDAVSKAASTLDSSKEYTDTEIAKIKLNENQLNAVNSGITQAKVTKYDGYEELINSKPNMSNVYTKIEVNDTFETKTDATSKLNKAKDHTTTEVSNLKKYTDEQFKKINDNLIATVDCSHKYEITGNTGDEHGLAIDDQQMLIKKIQGHSRRKSLNLLKDKSEYVGTVQFSISKSVLTINGTTNLDTTWFGLPVDFLPTNFMFSTFNTSAVTDCDILFMRSGTPIDHIASVPTNSVKKISNIESISIRLNGNGKVFNNVKIPIMINEGTTALPFQPYDNTLVNSNNTLISTGRNLVDINEYAKGRTKQGQTTNVTDYPKLTCSSTGDARLWNFKSADYYLSLPKGQYKIVIDNLTRVENYSLCNVFLPNGIIVASSSLSVGKNVINLNLETDNIIGIMSKMPNSSFNIGLFFKDENNEYEYKQDVVQAPSLGEFDYYQEGKIYRQTSQVVTLNGSENWGIDSNSPNKRFYYRPVDAVDNVDAINVVSNNLKEASANDTYSLSQENNLISVASNTIHIVKRDFTTVDQLKQWLQQNPIQLVYKLATPTIEDYAIPSGYAVYNGGLQIQQGDVPYTITKQYNLSQKAQILANVEIDREQQKQIDENNQKFNLIPKFSHVDINQSSTATNGTITQGQLTTLQENDLNYIIFNNEIYSLNDKTHTADTLTYSHVGFENGKHLLKTISITVSTRAWVLNTTIVNQGGTTPAPTDELIGTWVFNDKLSFEMTTHTFNVNFESNSIKYTYMKWYIGKGDGYFAYNETEAFSLGESGGGLFPNYATWQNNAYKTIKITDVSNLTNRTEFENFLKSNATKQGNGGSADKQFSLWKHRIIYNDENYMFITDGANFWDSSEGELGSNILATYVERVDEEGILKIVGTAMTMFEWGCLSGSICPSPQPIKYINVIYYSLTSNNLVKKQIEMTTVRVTSERIF